MTSPNPPQLPGAPCADDPTGLRYDRGDLDQTTTRTAGDGWALTGRTPITVPDLLCGHLPGECEDPADCAYWRGVALGEYAAPDGTFMTPVARPPFNLRQLAEQHTTAAEQDRRERGAA